MLANGEWRAQAQALQGIVTDQPRWPPWPPWRSVRTRPWPPPHPRSFEPIVACDEMADVAPNRHTRLSHSGAASKEQEGLLPVWLAVGAPVPPLHPCVVPALAYYALHAAPLVANHRVAVGRVGRAGGVGRDHLGDLERVKWFNNSSTVVGTTTRLCGCVSGPRARACTRACTRARSRAESAVDVHGRATGWASSWRLGGTGPGGACRSWRPGGAPAPPTLAAPPPRFT